MDEHNQEEQLGSEESSMSKSERREARIEERREREAFDRSSRENSKRMKWIVIFAVLAVVVYGIIKANDGPKRVDGPGDEVVALFLTEDEWIKGNPQAPNVLVEYSDFQCPACRAYHSSVQRLADAFPDELQIVYRHFPLKQTHPNAQLAGQAAEAAGMQGKFWEMHDELFDNQNQWSNERDPQDRFVAYATTIELDVDRFIKDLKSKDARRGVDDDFATGLRASVNSTPSFFLNGQLIRPSTDYESFRALIKSSFIPTEDVGVEIELTTSTPAS